MSGPRWIKQWISDMAALNEQFRNDDGLVDFDALGREEYSFRVALITKKFGKSERAREIYRVAKIAYDSSVENGKKGGRPKKSPQDAPNGNAGGDMYDAGEASHREAEDESATFSGADFTARQSRQVSATADALVNQTRAGAGAQALAVRNLPRNKEEVRLFAIDNGLDVDDANDWAEMNLRERHGRDKDGKPIRNWKGAILNYCKTMAAKRETA